MSNIPIVASFASTGYDLIAPMTGSVPPASTTATPNFRSFPVNARGFIVQSLVLGGTNPSTYLVGLNKKSLRSTFAVRDAFHAQDLLISSVEIYNTSTTTSLDVIGVAFRGEYSPSPSVISSTSGLGNGLFSPIATSQASLAAVTTAGVITPGTVIEYVDSTTLALVSWTLVFNNTSPATGAGITVPSDYNATTNPYVWVEV